MNKLISIVTPFYNEEESIHDYFSVIDDIFGKIANIDYEIVAVDDGSKDKTHAILSQLALQRKNLKVIKLSRNFGKEIAVTAGLDHANGDAVIPMDADLQDSPQIAVELIKKWQEGYKVVLAERASREDPILKKITAACFYKLASKIIDSNIPNNVGDFRLMDRVVLESVKKIRERNRFMRGILSWVGYKTTVVKYQRSARFKGETKYNYNSMIKYALDGIFSFSTFPIRMITYCGIFISLLSFIYGIQIIIDKIFYNQGIPGYASIMSTVLFLGGINFIFIGIIGEYVAEFLRK